MIFSIIYIVLSTATAWQTQALLQVKNKKEMQTYVEADQLDKQCTEESLYLLFPVSCNRSMERLRKLRFINQYQANLRILDLEKRCGNRVSIEVDIQKLFLLDARVDPTTKCKAKIEERIKDLLYSQS